MTPTSKSRQEPDRDPSASATTRASTGTWYAAWCVNPLRTWLLRCFSARSTSRHRYAPMGHGSCLPWLYGIAAHIAGNEARRLVRESEALRRMDRIGPARDEVLGIAWRVDAQRCVEESGIINAVNRLRDDERETLCLYASVMPPTQRSQKPRTSRSAPSAPASLESESSSARHSPTRPSTMRTWSATPPSGR